MSCEPGCTGCACLRARAVEIVGSGGLEALSVEALAGRVGSGCDAVRAHYATADACLEAAFDELAFELFVDMAGAFVGPVGWEAAFAAGFGRLLARLAASPAQARLCFVEAPRGSRVLRRRRTISRQWVVELLLAEHARRCAPATLTRLQGEMLAGAGVQAIAALVAAGRCDELPRLEARMRGLLDVFAPITA